jgi:hypothetical protein
MKKLTWAYIILLIIGAVIGVFFILNKPRYFVSLTGAASSDSLLAYQQRIDSLQSKLDSTTLALQRHGVIGQIPVRLRVAQIERQLNALRAAVRIWRAGHDQYGVGQAYRECVLLYGQAQSACQSLSFDTLPPQPDTLHFSPE